MMAPTNAFQTTMVLDLRVGHGALSQDVRETSLVELPPGTYRATHWIVFNSYWGPGLLGGREFKAQLKPSKFTEPFKIKGGEVVFLGRFVTDNYVAGGYQMRTPKEYAAHVRKLLATKPPRLSRPLMETVAIIAYRQPITRPEIEQLRGVDTGGVLETLL